MSMSARVCRSMYVCPYCMNARECVQRWIPQVQSLESLHNDSVGQLGLLQGLPFLRQLLVGEGGHQDKGGAGVLWVTAGPGQGPIIMIIILCNHTERRNSRFFTITRPSNPTTDPIRPANPRTDPIRPANPRTDPIRPANPRTDPIRPANPRTDPIRPANPRTDPQRPANPRTDPLRPTKSQN